MRKYNGYSPRASLAGVGVWFTEHRIWDVVSANVVIDQKVIVHTPTEKLLDAFIGILAGGRGVVEVNTVVRPDGVLQRAFGRTACAEQSTISQTLDASTTLNVAQLRAASDEVFKRHAKCLRHDYRRAWQLLDVDITGMPAGRQGEGVTKGYFAGRKNCRGRQLGRVLATRYDEIVVDRLFTGKRQLVDSLKTLVRLAEQSLVLSPAQRRRTILRIDGGGGSDPNINWMLNRGYHLVAKVHTWTRAVKLAASVRRWYADPKVADREVGWVTSPHAYRRPTRQIAIRKRKKDGTWSYHALVTTLDDAALFEMAGCRVPRRPSRKAVLLAALHAYDLRGGGLETQNRGDKQGLGLAHRNKRRFLAQEMLVLLAQLAHNVTVWARDAIAKADAAFQRFGVQRVVRDLFHVPGHITFDHRGRLSHIALNWRHPYAPAICSGFRQWLGADKMLFLLDKT